ncbi:MAG TPA: M1 family metallopeptidase [bacterium]|nr:M1 family metallopeptidase [bacterium]HOZ20382.1 M1 family metallopeptidase [bacterium]
MAFPRTACCMLFLAGSLLILKTGAGQPVLFPEPKSPRIANYDIDVRLDAAARLLHGHEILRWRNTADHAVEELQFHLYLNGFRNNRSTFMRESGGRHRGESLSKEGWGYIEIDSLTSAAGEEWLSRTDFIQPDDGNTEDKTVLRLLLPRSLPPGETITLRLAFTAKLPEPPMARTGIKKEFVMAGQWFPKIGVYENGAWNCHQFHANSEFYADFGVYNVNITVPRDYIVGATGLCYATTDNPDSTITHRFHAEDVHDFAWTASPDFIVLNGQSQDVEIRALIQKDHASMGARYLKAAEIAVAWFQDQYGDYPYPNLTVVDPRRGAAGAGGMEYPTLITAWGAYGMPEGIRALEMVIMHEFGHNYWYHLVASNEFEEAWLDEGINTFSEMQILADTYGEAGSMVDFRGIRISDTQMQRMSYISEPGLDPILQPAWKYYSGGNYASMSYNKPGLMLLTLQNWLGRETMNRILRTWFERWQFKHPRSTDFVAVVNEVSGQNFDWFFDQALHSTAVLDYSVSLITSKKENKGRGFDYFSADSAAAALPADTLASADAGADADSLRKDTEADSGESALDDQHEDKKEAGKKEEEKALYHSTVHVRRLGEFIFPVELQMIFADGDTVTEKWDGKARWHKFSVTRPSRLLSATIDPENKILLDVQLTNNSRTLESSSRGINKLTARLLFWTQFFLDMPAFFNLFTAFSPNM